MGLGSLARRFVGGLLLAAACSSGDGGGAARDATFAPPPQRVVADATGPIGGGSGDGAVGATCDLSDPQCPDELACYRSGCATPGSSALGAACARDTDCGRGMVCAGQLGDQRCREVCRISDGHPCARCQSLLPDKDVGYCP